MSTCSTRTRTRSRRSSRCTSPTSARSWGRISSPPAAASAISSTAMLRSIHGKFLGWLSIILLLVIGGFGGSLYFLVRQSKLGEIDADLAVTAQVLAENFRTRRPPFHNGRKKGWPEPGDPENRERFRGPPFPEDWKEDHRPEPRG